MISGARTLEMPRQNVKSEGSERADRKIAQPQIGETAPLPDTEQRPVERLPQKIVAAPHRNADTFAEEPAFEIGAAAKFAAVRGVGAVEPESKCNAVAEQQVHLAPLQGKARGVGIGIRPQLGLGE